MLNTDQIRGHLEQLLQQGPLAGLTADMRLLLQSQISALLQKADLVSREEFDVQRESLQRTQARLAELEERLTQLEQGR